MFGLWGFIIGILLLLAGIFLVFFFPTAGDMQPDDMAWTGVLVGIAFLIIGAALVFL